MSVESPGRIEGLAIQRVANEVGNEISKALKPRLQSHLVEEEPSISISFALKEGNFSGSYRFTEEEFLQDVYRTRLIIDTDDGFFGTVKVIKRKGIENIYIETSSPAGKIKLVADEKGKWHLDKSEWIAPIDSFELESFQHTEFLDDSKAADMLAYLSGLVREVDQDLNNDSHVVSYLLNSRSHRGR